MSLSTESGKCSTRLGGIISIFHYYSCCVKFRNDLNLASECFFIIAITQENTRFLIMPLGSKTKTLRIQLRLLDVIGSIVLVTLTVLKCCIYSRGLC